VEKETSNLNFSEKSHGTAAKKKKQVFVVRTESTHAGTRAEEPQPNKRGVPGATKGFTGVLRPELAGKKTHLVRSRTQKHAPESHKNSAGGWGIGNHNPQSDQRREKAGVLIHKKEERSDDA